MWHQVVKSVQAYPVQHIFCDTQAVMVCKQGSALAEGLYHQAWFAGKDGNHEESNALVQRLVRELPAEREWAGKGLLIMASNFDAMNDLFQATYILESIVERFSGYPEIVNKAREELQLLKARQDKNLTTSPKN